MPVPVGPLLQCGFGVSVEGGGEGGKAGSSGEGLGEGWLVGKGGEKKNKKKEEEMQLDPTDFERRSDLISAPPLTPLSPPTLPPPPLWDNRRSTFCYPSLPLAPPFQRPTLPHSLTVAPSRLVFKSPPSLQPPPICSTATSRGVTHPVSQLVK